MKRVLSFVLMLTLILTMIPVSASAAKGDKLIALTFDDGPDATDTPRLLDGLKERGVSVTFFVQGQSLEWGSRYVKRAYAEGHEIASHSWNHPNLPDLSTEKALEQFSKTAKLLDKICGKGADYLIRPPYGNSTADFREKIDAPLIHWSVDTLDWQTLNEYSVRDSILREAYDGAIVLLHDIHSTSVDGALMAIDVLLDRGYELVTVSELYRRRGVELKDGERYYHLKPNGTDLGPIPEPKITYTTDKKTMEITITAGSDAPVYYTTDGSAPTTESKIYSGPFTVDYPCNIRAVAAYKLNGCRSKTAVLAMGVTPCDPPQMKVEDMKLILSHELENVDIHYTLDGSTPTYDSPMYTGPVEIKGGHYIRAIAGGGFYAKSKELKLYCSENGNLYADVKPGDWYYQPIDNLVTLGLMNGVGEHRFAPNTKLTRAMMVTLLYRCSGDDLGDGWKKTSKFTDVKSGKYYSEAVEWAYRNKIVNGDSPKIFRPDGNITRQEMCKVIDGYLAYRGCELARGSSCKKLFSDYSKIAKWALSSVEAMVAAGLIKGDNGRMNPAGNATRAEVATVLDRMLRYEQEHLPEPDPEPTVPPTEQPTEPEPTDPIEPTEEPTTAPTEAPTEPSEPTEPSTEPTEPSTEPTEPSENPTEPSQPEPTEPEETTAPTEAPTEETTAPTEVPTEPPVETTAPSEPEATE